MQHKSANDSTDVSDPCSYKFRAGCSAAVASNAVNSTHEHALANGSHFAQPGCVCIEHSFPRMHSNRNCKRCIPKAPFRRGGLALADNAAEEKRGGSGRRSQRRSENEGGW